MPLRNLRRRIVVWARVDVENYARVMAAAPWHRASTGHVRRGDWVEGRCVPTFLHRFVMGLSKGDPGLDHRDLDPLNNTRANLRFATTAENGQNRPAHGISRFRGVTWHNGRWRARHILQGKEHTIGYFDDEGQAGQAAADWRKQHMPFSKEASQ